LAAGVPYTVVARSRNPKKLLVEAYGSYGISASRGYPVHWLPWLQRGYAIAVAMPRGGRENGDAWYDAARTAVRKKTTFEDVLRVIKHVQGRLRLGPQNTVIYGRSAGGWMAAYIGLAHPDCVGAVYAEVPYLDILRTTTNPALPLTMLEYDEFGHPAERPKEYAALQTLSPVDLASSAASAGVYPFFLVRTALHDAQVLPYEALKFAARLRAGGWPADRVVVGIDADGGHFAAESAWAEQLGTDAALLDVQIAPRGRRRQTRRVARSQTAMGTYPRRTISRKHRTRHSTSPPTV
jgi:oligopeptidase B